MGDVADIVLHFLSYVFRSINCIQSDHAVLLIHSHRATLPSVPAVQPWRGPHINRLLLRLVQPLVLFMGAST